ncbi:unnamed protein product, partial [Rotaria magnacalcarata]
MEQRRVYGTPKPSTSNAATEGERKRRMTQGVVEQPIK